MKRIFFASLVFAGVVSASPQWIWSDLADPAPKNRFTYFRKVVSLETVPAAATLLVAADSNAWVWVNGHEVRRKMTRYHEARITAEQIDAAPYLHAGSNTIVVLHHNWGDIITFQRDANKHAGLWVGGNVAESGASWRWTVAPELLAHERRILGVNTHQRIRYPVVMDARKRMPGDAHSASFDDHDWKPAVVVANGPWPATPTVVEMEPQREYATRPLGVVAAGTVQRAESLSDDPLSIAKAIRLAKHTPEQALTTAAAGLVQARPMEIGGRAGETKYVTLDFHRPVHGYPFLALEAAKAGTVIDFGYGEISYSQYSGKLHVSEDGWLNPEGVVGPGYADRYITADGAQSATLPDERTARWMTVHLHFKEAGSVKIRDLGIVKSQYSLRWLGSFSCGDEQIDQIVKLSLMHAEITMSDGYVDTPGREDGQWIEDARLRAVIASRWSADTRLRRSMIRLHAESQREDGGFHAFPPSNYPAYPVGYDWAVQWTAMLYDDYMWTADKTFARRYFPVLDKFWANALARVGEDGLWRTRRLFADIRVGQHPKSDQQSSGIVTPFMIERLRWSADLADAIGETGRAASWRAHAGRMAGAFRKFHIVPAQGAIPAHVGDRVDTSDAALDRGCSQAGQINALLAGVATCAEFRANIEHTFTAPDGVPSTGVARWNNPTFAYRALRMLSDCGLPGRAVAHLKERYAPYLAANPRNRVPLKLQGPYGGPLPEYWISREDLGLKDGELNSAQPIDETGSHGWGAVPLLWLHDTLLGVRILEAGGAKLRIAPQTGGLPFVAGHTMTPKGLVYVHWDPRLWRLETILPEGVAAEIVIPTRDGRTRTFHAARPGVHIFNTNSNAGTRQLL
jgi:hypothetical protein